MKCRRSLGSEFIPNYSMLFITTNDVDWLKLLLSTDSHKRSNIQSIQRRDKIDFYQQKQIFNCCVSYHIHVSYNRRFPKCFNSIVHNNFELRFFLCFSIVVCIIYIWTTRLDITKIRDRSARKCNKIAFYFSKFLQKMLSWIFT